MNPIDSRRFPEYPGLFFVKDSFGKLIFVGMTVDLRRRIAAIFEEAPIPPQDLSLMSSRNFKKIPQMLGRAASVEVLLLASEAQRVCLTNSLIERHRPHYNLATFLDVTGYAYIQQTNEPFARLIIGGQFPGWQRKSRGHKLNNGTRVAATFGPFPSGPARTLFLKCLNESLGLRTCDSLPGRACPLYACGRCCAPCEGKISTREYEVLLEQARAYLENPAAFLDFLDARMQSAAQEMQFERAMLLRDELKTLRASFQRMQQAPYAARNQDVIYEDQGLGLILHLRRGWFVDFLFVEAEEDPLTFLQRIYPGSHPPEIIVPDSWDAALLSDQLGWRICSPETAQAREWMECASMNVKLRRNQLA